MTAKPVGSSAAPSGGTQVSTTRPWWRSTSARRTAHLAVLWSFAIAQPAFSVIASTPEFFTLRSVGWLDGILFAVALTTGPPLLMGALELGLSRRLSERRIEITHSVLMGALGGILALQVIKRMLGGTGEQDPMLSAPFVIACAVTIAIAGGALYLTAPRLRSLLNVLLPAPLLFVGGFAAQTHASTGGFAEGKARPVPVVVVVFDELPALSLMTPHGEIDAVRYPAFARLTRTATWYREAASVSDSTNEAVPALLTGRRAKPGQAPSLEEHPDNLFTLLSKSHRMNVTEPFTSLCPEAVCPIPAPSLPARLVSLLRDAALIDLRFSAPHDIEHRMPELPERTRLSGSTEQHLDRFLRGLPDQPGPVLSFVHLSLPHHPWARFPSGIRYLRAEDELPPPGLINPDWLEHPWLVHQAWQRHLLQTGYADRILGRILDRLEALGTLDDALLVVAADHGISFRPGGQARYVERANVGAIASVPLMVKAPHQKSGRISDEPVQTTDMLALVAREIGMRLPRSVSGSSGRSTTVEVTSPTGETVRVDRPEFRRLRREVLEQQTSLFGTGDSSALLRLDTRPDLLGLSAHALPTHGFTSADATFDHAQDYQRVRSASGYVPSLISGRLGLSAGDRDREVAVVVNGRVAGTATGQRTGPEERFSLLAEPSVLHDGRNKLEVYVR